MNRIIKFRGKRLDNGEWVYGDLEYNRAKNIACIHTYGEDGKYLMQHSVDLDTVGQFTGLLDKNGNEIYEGDIVNVRRGERAFDIVVKWSSEAMAFIAYYADGNQSPLSWLSDLRMYQLRVIGSIHDNSELLNEK